MGKLILITFLLLTNFAFANGKKMPDVVINFFVETNNDPGKKLSFAWQTSLGKKYFKVASEFKTSDIMAQRPFPSPHSDTEYGMIFQLDAASKNRLSVLTSNNIGKYLIVFINNKPLDMVYIDKRVDDGLICVWRGLSAQDVHMADKLTHRIGETEKQWKARLKK